MCALGHPDCTFSDGRGTEPANWTLAYRRSKSANRFHRVTDYAATWHEAMHKAGEVGALHPDYEIWFVPTRTAELRAAATSPAHAEDVANILTTTGKRVAMTDTGTMAQLG